MSLLDVAVIIAGLGLMVFLLWFFFGPKQGKAAAIRAGVQEAVIRVEGAYQPSVVKVKAGLPVRLKFDRREGTDCSNRVVIPDFDISRALPAFQTTTIDFTPQEPGEYPFACWMNMYRGTIVLVAVADISAILTHVAQFALQEGIMAIPWNLIVWGVPGMAAGAFLGSHLAGWTSATRGISSLDCLWS